MGLSGGDFVTIAIVAVGFIGNAMYLKGVFGTKIQNLETSVEHIRTSVQFKDTCEALTKGLRDRICRIESAQNGRH